MEPRLPVINDYQRPMPCHKNRIHGFRLLLALIISVFACSRVIAEPPRMPTRQHTATEEMKPAIREHSQREQEQARAEERIQVISEAVKGATYKTVFYQEGVDFSLLWPALSSSGHISLEEFMRLETVYKSKDGDSLRGYFSLLSQDAYALFYLALKSQEAYFISHSWANPNKELYSTLGNELTRHGITPEQTESLVREMTPYDEELTDRVVDLNRALMTMRKDLSQIHSRNEDSLPFAVAFVDWYFKRQLPEDGPAMKAFSVLYGRVISIEDLLETGRKVWSDTTISFYMVKAMVSAPILREHNPVDEKGQPVPLYPESDLKKYLAEYFIGHRLQGPAWFHWKLNGYEYQGFDPGFGNEVIQPARFRVESRREYYPELDFGKSCYNFGGPELNQLIHLFKAHNVEWEQLLLELGLQKETTSIRYSSKLDSGDMVQAAYRSVLKLIENTCPNMNSVLSALRNIGAIQVAQQMSDRYSTCGNFKPCQSQTNKRPGTYVTEQDVQFLAKCLEDLSDWEGFAIWMDMGSSVIEAIKAEALRSSNSYSSKRRQLAWILVDRKATFEEVISALEKMQNKRLSGKVERYISGTT